MGHSGGSRRTTTPQPHSLQKSSRTSSKNSLSVFSSVVVLIVDQCAGEGQRASRGLSRDGSLAYFSICFFEPEPIAIFFGLISAGFGMCTASTPSV